jgi:hypothetical protein
VAAAHLEGSAHALVGLGGWEPHVDDGELGVVLVDGGDERLAVADRGDHLVAFVGEQGADALAQQHEVLADHDLHGDSESIIGTAAPPESWFRRPRGYPP